MSHLPVLVILLPLCGTLLCPLISHFSADWGKRTVICTLFLAVICSLVQLWQVISGKEALHYEPVSYTHLDVYKRQPICLTE